MTEIVGGQIAGTNGLPTIDVIEKEKIGISGLEAEDFLNMLIEQLKHQDPTEPTDSEQILTQVSQLRDLQASTDLSDTLRSLVSGSELSNAAGLIGQRVSGINADGELVEGTATSARLVDGKAVLKVLGQDIKLEDVRSVGAREAAESAAAANGPSETFVERDAQNDLGTSTDDLLDSLLESSTLPSNSLIEQNAQNTARAAADDPIDALLGSDT